MCKEKIRDENCQGMAIHHTLFWVNLRMIHVIFKNVNALTLSHFACKVAEAQYLSSRTRIQILILLTVSKLIYGI